MDQEFFETLFGGEKKGYLNAAFSKGDSFKRRSYPIDKLSGFYADCERAASRGYNCYFVPSVFVEPRGTKIYFDHSNVVWLDYDKGGDQPNWELEPTYVVQSSEGKYHAYWKLDGPGTMIQVEMANKAMAQNHDADMSGWDANQLLRVPGTLNYKYDPPQKVEIIKHTERSYSVDDFPKAWGPNVPGLVQTFL